MSKPETENFSLVEISRVTTLPVPSTSKRLLVAKHFFAGTPGHRLLAQGTREACFAALRLMEQPDPPAAQRCFYFTSGGLRSGTFTEEPSSIGDRIYHGGKAYLIVDIIMGEELQIQEVV